MFCAARCCPFLDEDFARAAALLLLLLLLLLPSASRRLMTVERTANICFPF
jgi:hypothetical protein